MSDNDTTVHVIKRGSKLFRQNADGTETEMPVPRPSRAMTDEETHAAALSDPDCLPLSMRKLGKQRPRSFIIRRALKLTQEEFAARYHLDRETLRRWETGDIEPDKASRTLLRLIASDPEGTARLLAGQSHKDAAE